MIQTRFRPAIRAACAAVVFSLFATYVEAQTSRRPQPTPQSAVEAQQPVDNPVAPALNQNAAETRRQLYRVLDQYPPGLGRIMRLDPTLMTNPNYLGSYPNLAAFLAQYPDIPRNPGYYLERYDPNFTFNEPPDARREAVRMWRDALEFLGAFAVFTVITLLVFSLLKYIVEYRRWYRISKVNTEVHNKILDRFGSNEELLAYIDSPAGRRFLEAAPMAPAPVTSRVGAPFGRILISVQIGLMLMALAVGLRVVSGNAIEEVQQVMQGLAVIGFALGIGCIISAGASYVLSRRLGLLPDSSATTPPAPLA
jgi:hypothetical protein